MHLPYRRPRRERGVAAVEFAVCAIVFFAFIGGLIETARILYVINTMGEVTRHGARLAATANFCDSAAMFDVRNEAVFGGIPAVEGITEANVKIAYLQADAVTPVAPRPDNPMENLKNCTANPAASNCIRFVRVRLCASGTDCDQIGFKSWFPVGALMPPTGIPMPRFATVTPTENFGYRPDTPTTCN